MFRPSFTAALNQGINPTNGCLCFIAIIHFPDVYKKMILFLPHPAAFAASNLLGSDYWIFIHKHTLPFQQKHEKSEKVSEDKHKELLIFMKHIIMASTTITTSLS